MLGEAEQGSHLHDLAGGSLGVKAVWNGITVGGGFVYDGADTLPLDRRPGHVGLESVVSEINVGAAYDLKDWSFGASWAHDYRKALPSTDILALGAVYRIARGLTIGADLSHYGRPRGTGEAETNALLVETAVHF